jgi:hypothetical protein
VRASANSKSNSVRVSTASARCSEPFFYGWQIKQKEYVKDIDNLLLSLFQNLGFVALALKVLYFHQYYADAIFFAVSQSSCCSYLKMK